MWKGWALDQTVDLQFPGSLAFRARKGSPLPPGLLPGLPHGSPVPRLKGTCMRVGDKTRGCCPSFRLKGIVTRATAPPQEEGSGKEALKGGSVS